MKKSDIKKLVKELTLKEKAMLLSGQDSWSTLPLERLGIPSLKMADGPHGIRVRKDSFTEESEEAVCFPPSVLLASSWDEALARKQGRAIAEEAISFDLGLVLGPGNNIKRNPLCGRNFEYFSEDPYLSGHIAAGVIEGIQSKKVGATIKHFAANAQETNRLLLDEKIGERALREIYLASFEYPVKVAKPAAVMCAYNKINGIYCSENKWLLTDILRKEWGYKGLVMSDWGAVSNRPQGVYAGLDLEMPTSNEVGANEIIKAVNGEKTAIKPSDKRFKNKLLMREIDRCVERVLTLALSYSGKNKPVPSDRTKLHKTAREVARESMVLLKNEGLLPLKKGRSLALIGEMAVNPRFQGGGSSWINAVNVTKPLDAFSEYSKTTYSRGYDLENDSDLSYINEAVKTALECDDVVIIAGLPLSYEYEAADRRNMSMPQSHIELINAVSKVRPDCTVVLCNGSAVEIPFADKVRAILEAYLGGEAGAEAMTDILFGRVNPCGKLAETIPERLEHTPSFTSFPGTDAVTHFDEGIFVGYRWYDTRKIKPKFPFGFGLSYTTYEYENLRLSADKITQDDKLVVTVTVKNTGKVDGKEIVQLYVRENNSRVNRPEKELKGFKKVLVKSGESVDVSFMLDKRSFAYWDDKAHEWALDSGKFTVLVGSSSDNCPLCAEVEIKGRDYFAPITPDSLFITLRNHPNGYSLAKRIAKANGLDYDKETAKEDSERIRYLDGSMLKQTVLMFNGKMTLQELVDEIDKLNSEAL